MFLLKFFRSLIKLLKPLEPFKPVGIVPPPTPIGPGEKLVSPYEFVHLFDTNREAIYTAKFIMPQPGSKQILGRVWVKLNPGYEHAL